jgi:transmembrane sensor
MRLSGLLQVVLRRLNGYPTSAAGWFAARLRGSDRRSERAFETWLAASSAHREEYALCEIAWEVARVPAGQLPVPADRRLTPAARRSAFMLLAGAAATLAGVWVMWPAHSETWTTGAGEQRTLILDDGSRVTLNTRTRLSVRMARRTRDVELVQGEAFFEVTKDASRPFTVHTRLGTARAVGTRFNVYLGEQKLGVTTEEGRVLVRTPRGTGVMVDAGQSGAIRSGEDHVVLARADPRASFWLTKRLDVDDESLGDVLQDFSRYTLLPVRPESPAVASRHVTAVLRAGDLDALRTTLQGAFGLAIERRGDAWVVVDPSAAHERSP